MYSSSKDAIYVFKQQKRDAINRVPTDFAMQCTLFLSAARDAGTGMFGQLPGGAGAALRADGRGLRAAGGGGGSATHDVDEAEEHGPVYDAQHDLEEPVGRAETIHYQVDQGRHDDVEERDGDEDQPGELHQLVGAQARQRTAHPDEDEAEQVDLGGEVADGQQVAQQAPTAIIQAGQEGYAGTEKPPRKIKVAMADTMVILPYSPRKNIAQRMPLYSVR